MNIDRKVIEQALEALNHGITEMNHRGCAIECMPLHHATKALREALVKPQPVPKGCQKVELTAEQEAGLTCSASHIPGLAAPQTQPVQPVQPKIDRDTITVNLLRHAGLDKHKARECADLVLLMIEAAQPQPVQQEPCPECDGTGTVAGSQAHFPCPICTSPQAAQPLSDEQERAAFERVARQEGCTDFRRVGDGYTERRTLRCWRIWQAAHGIKKGTT